jgi:hypothetical protein
MCMAFNTAAEGTHAIHRVGTIMQLASVKQSDQVCAFAFSSCGFPLRFLSVTSNPTCQQVVTAGTMLCSEENSDIGHMPGAEMAWETSLRLQETRVSSQHQSLITAG